MLVAHGPSTEALSLDGNTPLYYAAVNSSVALDTIVVDRIDRTGVIILSGGDGTRGWNCGSLEN